MAEPQLRSLPSLVGDAIRETHNVVSKEIALFRTEMSEGLHQLAMGLSLFISATLLAVTGVLVLILALVKGLATVLHSEAMAALVVGGGFAVVALGLALWGRSKVSLASLEPTRTERQVRQDAGIITERMGG
ncbi:MULTISPECIES: phage holin family protein [unclassified Methylobacterium]|uniref:phage holin family protein n=1 Tax=unclassified Methylobacterium TaxID=2615210 RepID=UPI001D0C025D|nr:MULTISPECIES: phage holin family protein [unclassified Methylobacterium]MCC0808048.1 phage holin family protein [Methylobacterium sp. W2]MCJ2127286.1 phage holin family protein [Methylobacterium sp. E-045]